MPELPEVETIRRDLNHEVSGRRIRTVEVSGVRSIRRHPRARDFVSRLEGRKVVGVIRKGKYLLIKLEGGDVLVAHLGMSGQLLLCPATNPRAKHTHVVVTFTEGGELRFVDPRTFGELFVSTPDELADVVPELAHLGFDPLEQMVSRSGFAELLRARRTKLKALLMDQRFIAGIGNLYADEILFAAGLRFDRSSQTLTAGEARRLQSAIVETLNNAIRHRGSSLADEQYRDLFGRLGGFQARHEVYGREGQACRRCRDPIVRIKASGRSTFLCARCQV
jgi:formamidopyrimidine-DNA glycosylase